MPRYKKRPTKKSQLDKDDCEVESQCSMTTSSSLNSSTAQSSSSNTSNSTLNTSSTSSSSLNISTSTQSTDPTTTKSNSTNPSSPSAIVPIPKRAIADLEIGTIDLRLHIPGLFDVLLPIPAPASSNKMEQINEISNEFENKYWIRLNLPGQKFKCLICEEGFALQTGLQAHLAEHMGFPIARCTKCSETFYCIVKAEQHLEKCGK